MKKREIDYVINFGDIFEVNADDDDIAPTGDFVCGFKRNRQIVPDNDKESDIMLALRVAEELFEERMAYYQATNTELEYDELTGDPIEVFDDNFEKMPVDYSVFVWSSTNSYEALKLSVESLGESCVDDCYPDKKVDNLLDMFSMYARYFDVKVYPTEYFYYHGYKYVITTETI